MKKIKFITLFLLAFLFGISLASCNSNKKYEITNVTNAKNVVVNKNEKLLTFTVDNDVTNFDASNISIKNGKPVVYENNDYASEVTTLNLEIGENTFYLKIKLNNKDKFVKNVVWKIVVTREQNSQQPEEYIPLNKDEITDCLISMLAVFETGTDRGDEYEISCSSLLKDEDTLVAISYIVEGMEEAKISNPKAKQAINLIKEKAVGRSVDVSLEEIAEYIVDTLKRMILAIREIDSYVTPEQLGIVLYKFYVNINIDNEQLKTDLEMVSDYVDAETYKKLEKTINDSKTAFVPKDEFVEAFKAIFEVIKAVGTVSDNELDAIAKIISLSEDENFDVTSIGEEEIANINQLGQLLTRLNNSVTKDSIYKVVYAFAKIDAGRVDNPFLLKNAKMIDLYVNCKSTLKFFATMLTDVTLEQYQDTIAVFTSLSNELSDESEYAELGKKIVTTCNLFNSTYNKLSEVEKLEFIALLKQIIDMTEPTATVDVDYIRITVENIGKLASNPNVDYVKVTKDFIEAISKNLDAKLIVLENEYLLLKENSTVNDLLNILNNNLEITYKKYDKTTELYETTDITLDESNLVDYELSKIGLQQLTINVNGLKKTIFYYIFEEKPSYVVLPESLYMIDNLLAYDLDGNRYEKNYSDQAMTLYLVSKKDYTRISVSVPFEKISIINPDYKTEGIKYGVLEAKIDEETTYYLPIQYYVIDAKEEKITHIEVNFYNKVYQNYTTELNGNLKVFKNFGVKIYEDGKWDEFNFDFVEFQTGNVMNLDVTKSGMQKITIVKDDLVANAEVEVISPAVGKDITNIYASANTTYLENSDYESIIDVSLQFVNNYEYSYYGTFKGLKEYFVSKGLDYDIELNLGDLKVGVNKCYLKLTNKETGNYFVEKFTFELVSLDEYNKITNLTIQLKDSLFAGYSKDEIMNKITGLSFGNNYKDSQLYGDAAISWAKGNLSCELDKENSQIIFKFDEAECAIDGIFSVTPDMVELYYSVNNDQIPSFFKNLDEIVVFDSIISSMEISDAGIYYLEPAIRFETFKKIGSIEITDEVVNFKIGEEIVKSYTFSEATNLELYSSNPYVMFFQKNSDYAQVYKNMTNSITLTYEIDDNYYSIYLFNPNVINNLVEKGFLVVSVEGENEGIRVTLKVNGVEYCSTVINDVYFYEASEAKNVARFTIPNTPVVFQKGLEKNLEKCLLNTELEVVYYDGTCEKIFGEDLKALVDSGKIIAEFIDSTTECSVVFTVNIGDNTFIDSTYVRFFDLDVYSFSSDTTKLYLDVSQYNQANPYSAITGGEILVIDESYNEIVFLSGAAMIKIAKEYFDLSYIEENGTITYKLFVNGKEIIDSITVK